MPSTTDKATKLVKSLAARMAPTAISGPEALRSALDAAAAALPNEKKKVATALKKDIKSWVKVLQKELDQLRKDAAPSPAPKSTRKRSMSDATTDSLSSAWLAAHAFDGSAEGLHTALGSSDEALPAAHFDSVLNALRLDGGRPDRLPAHAAALAAAARAVLKEAASGATPAGKKSVKKKTRRGSIDGAEEMDGVAAAAAAVGSWAPQARAALVLVAHRRSLYALSEGRGADEAPADEALAALAACWVLAAALSTDGAAVNPAVVLSFGSLGGRGGGRARASDGVCSPTFAAHLVGSLGDLGPAALAAAARAGAPAAAALRSLAPLAAAALASAGAPRGRGATEAASTMSASAAVRLLASARWCLDMAAAAAAGGPDLTNARAALRRLAVPPTAATWLLRSEPVLASAGSPGASSALAFVEAPVPPGRWRELAEQATAAFAASARADGEPPQAADGAASSTPDDQPLFFIDTGAGLGEGSGSEIGGAEKAALTGDLSEVFGKKNSENSDGDGDESGSESD